MKIFNKQCQIKDLMTEIINMTSETQGFNKKINLDLEMRKKEYVKCAQDWIKDMNNRITVSKKSHEVKPWFKTPLIRMWI